MRFRDRIDAGRQLARALQPYASRDDVLVFGLPRGGVPVAFEVAQALHAPLDVFIVRKLGVPFQPELAMGAVASGGIRVLHQEVIAQLGIPADVIDRIAAREAEEITRREAAFRGNAPAPAATGRTIILVDDGLATGSTMRAAVRALRPQKPARIVVAVPVAPPASCRDLRAEADELTCLYAPEGFAAVGEWYHDFSQTTDDEVRQLLTRAR